MGVPCLGLGWSGNVGRVIPCQKAINCSSDQFCHRYAFLLRSIMKAFKLLSSKVDIRSIHLFKFLVVCFSLVYNKYSKQGEKRQDAVLVYEYKLAGSPKQYAAIDEAIRIVQFIMNTCLGKWM